MSKKKKNIKFWNNFLNKKLGLKKLRVRSLGSKYIFKQQYKFLNINKKTVYYNSLQNSQEFKYFSFKLKVKYNNKKKNKISLIRRGVLNNSLLFGNTYNYLFSKGFHYLEYEYLDSIWTYKSKYDLKDEVFNWNKFFINFWYLEFSKRVMEQYYFFLSGQNWLKIMKDSDYNHILLRSKYFFKKRNYSNYLLGDGIRNSSYLDSNRNYFYSKKPFINYKKNSINNKTNIYYNFNSNFFSRVIIEKLKIYKLHNYYTKWNIFYKNKKKYLSNLPNNLSFKKFYSNFLISNYYLKRYVNWDYRIGMKYYNYYFTKRYYRDKRRLIFKNRYLHTIKYVSKNLSNKIKWKELFCNNSILLHKFYRYSKFINKLKSSLKVDKNSSDLVGFRKFIPKYKKKIIINKNFNSIKNKKYLNKKIRLHIETFCNRYSNNDPYKFIAWINWRYLKFKHYLGKRYIVYNFKPGNLLAAYNSRERFINRDSCKVNDNFNFKREINVFNKKSFFISKKVPLLNYDFFIIKKGFYNKKELYLNNFFKHKLKKVFKKNLFNLYSNNFFYSNSLKFYSKYNSLKFNCKFNKINILRYHILKNISYTYNFFKKTTVNINYKPNNYDIKKIGYKNYYNLFNKKSFFKNLYNKIIHNKSKFWLKFKSINDILKSQKKMSPEEILIFNRSWHLNYLLFKYKKRLVINNNNQFWFKWNYKNKWINTFYISNRIFYKYKRSLLKCFWNKLFYNTFWNLYHKKDIYNNYVSFNNSSSVYEVNSFINSIYLGPIKPYSNILRFNNKKKYKYFLYRKYISLYRFPCNSFSYVKKNKSNNFNFFFNLFNLWIKLITSNIENKIFNKYNLNINLWVINSIDIIYSIFGSNYLRWILKTVFIDIKFKKLKLLKDLLIWLFLSFITFSAELLSFFLGKFLSLLRNHHHILQFLTYFFNLDLFKNRLYNISGYFIEINGKFNGFEKTSKYIIKDGRYSLQTVDHFCDYNYNSINTYCGKIGIKVWMFSLKGINVSWR